ncbi:MAG TPA: SRPBCC family protein [Micromonosporaceae bacterium]|jgi:uncharacterized protein YndB with AHSA1/START domain
MNERILGSLRSVDGAGALRIEDRFDTTVEDLWSALTDPDRLRRWYGEVSGDLRPGGRFRLYIPSADIDATGRIDACEPPHRLAVTSRETDESYRRGNGVPPFDEIAEATLSADGDRSVLAIELRGMPLDKVAFYGAGWQIHVENLAALLAGTDPGDEEKRWEQLVPAYQALASAIE